MGARESVIHRAILSTLREYGGTWIKIHGNATQGGGSANPKTFSAGGDKGLRGAAIRITNATCGYALIAEGTGRITGDGNPPTSAPTGIN